MDMMIDLETLGTSARAPILSIGAATFDRKTGEIFETFHERTSPNLRRYDTDLETFRFWMAQGDDARKSLVVNPVPLALGLRKFHMFFHDNGSEKCRVWALPASFDLPILENAFRTEFGGGLDDHYSRPPWHYSAPRDLRTLFDLAGITKEDRVKPELAHDALSDCKAQVLTLLLAFDRLGQSDYKPWS